MPVASHPRISVKSNIASVLDPMFMLLAVLLPLLVSLPLIGTDLLGGNYTEFLLGVSRLGIIQYPGYPLYLLVSKWITWLVPFGTEIWQIHFGSLVFSILASLLVFLIGRRLYFPPFISLAGALLFFFSPYIWQAALTSRHDAFHAFMIVLCIYITLGILQLPDTRHLIGRLTAWAFFCGLTGAQHPALVAWVIPALILGLAVGLPRYRVKGNIYGWMLFGAFLGGILPYAYMPLRLLSPDALFDPELVSWTTTAVPSRSFKDMVIWLTNYTGEGAQSIFAIGRFHQSLSQFWETLLQFTLAYPFFPLAIVIFGLLLNLRTALLRQPGATVSGRASASRLILAILPLGALGGEVLLHAEHTDWTRLNLSLAYTFWSFVGLEYCYQILGHSDEQLAKTQGRLRPTWFGIIMVLSVPLLTFLQSYGPIKQTVPRAENPQGTLSQVKELMEMLPENSSLYFPDPQWQLPFSYVQHEMSVRPDVTLMSFSEPWPNMQLPKSRFWGMLGQPSRQRFLQQIAFSREWVRLLSRKTRPGTHQFLVIRPTPTEPTLQFLLQSLDLSESYGPFSVWEAPGKPKNFAVFRLRRRMADETPAQRTPFSKTFINDFDGRMRLVAGQLHKPVKHLGQLSLLQISLTWQMLRAQEKSKLRVLFRVVPATAEPALMNPAQEYLWKEARLLGAGREPEYFRDHAVLHETYQLSIPRELPPGRYHVFVALQDKQSNTLLPTGEVLDKPVYFSSACEFWVVDEASDGMSDANP